MHTATRENAHAPPLLPEQMAQRQPSILKVPFNEFLQIEPCHEPGGLLRLTPRACLENHIGTIHAGALMTLAEAASAAFLQRHFGMRPNIVPLLRRFEAKFCRPAQGAVTARASAEADALARFEHDMESKSWGLVTVDVELHDESDAKVLAADVSWYVKCVKPAP